jgi:hypothetical protein
VSPPRGVANLRRQVNVPNDTCSTHACTRPVFCRTVCRTHYDLARRSGAMPLLPTRRRVRGVCEQPACTRLQKARGLCALHYNAARHRNGRECAIEGCPRPVLSRGWCSPHYKRWQLHGVPDATPVWGDLTANTPAGLRLCRTCMEFLPEELFRIRKNRPGQPRASKCRPCVAKDWQDNRERNLAAKAARNFGVTREQYEAFMNGGCAVCGDRSNQSGRRLHIDHCHTTGKVRGALCHACNTALGLAGDSPTRLRELAAYIELHTRARTSSSR